MNEITFLTWTGAASLALCVVPMSWLAWRSPESTRGLSSVFLALWWVGELCMFAGLLNAVSWHVLANYLGNLILVSYVAGVKFLLPPRSGGQH